MVNSAITNPIQSSVSGLSRYVGLTLPARDSVLMLIKSVNGEMVDTIGKSISELYPLVDPALRSIISADGGATRRADADIVSLALASPSLNLGTLFSNAAGEIVLYAYDTADAVLTRAYRWARQVYVAPDITDFFNGFSLSPGGSVTNDGDGQYNSICCPTNSLVSGGVEAIFPMQSSELGPELAIPENVTAGAWTALGDMTYQIAGDGTFQELSVVATPGKKYLIDITIEMTRSGPGAGMCKSVASAYPTGVSAQVDHQYSGRYTFFYIPMGTKWSFGRYEAGVIINGTVKINSFLEISAPWRDYIPSTTVNFWGDSHTLNIAPRMDDRIHNATVYTGAVGGIDASDIIALFNAAPEKWGQPTYICAGSNGVETDPSTVISSIDEMVSKLTTDNFIILPPFGNNTATTGTAYRNNINTVKAHLLATYAGKYFDAEQFIIDSYNPDITQDVADYNNGITPSSLRSDAAHLTYKGYSMIADKILELFPDFCSYPGTEIFPKRMVTTSAGSRDAYIEADPATFKRCLVEPYSIQRFFNSSAPATQTTQSLVAGTYTLWCEGAGSITATAGTAVGTFGAATAGNPATITITTAGTVVLTCSGVLTWGQLDTLPFKGSKIYSAGAAVVRDARIVNIPNTIPRPSGNAQNFALCGRVIPQATPLTGRYILGNYTDASNYTAILFSSTQIISRKRVGGVNYDAALDLSYAANQPFDFVAGFTDRGSFMYARLITGSAKGDWAVGDSSNATAAKIAANHQIGSDGQGGNQVFAHFQCFSQINLSASASLDLYKAKTLTAINKFLND